MLKENILGTVWSARWVKIEKSARGIHNEKLLLWKDFSHRFFALIFHINQKTNTLAGDSISEKQISMRKRATREAIEDKISLIGSNYSENIRCRYITWYLHFWVCGKFWRGMWSGLRIEVFALYKFLYSKVCKSWGIKEFKQKIVWKFLLKCMNLV